MADDAAVSATAVALTTCWSLGANGGATEATDATVIDAAIRLIHRGAVRICIEWLTMGSLA